ncbi:MAG: glutamine--fructose-6-phosphate transaminase (isomerizing) [Oscillospiraceae bacterium]|nr:glutamine--fructose-6-phosphate transaminase (isomerizing) [Oscillospiraceae bacterium]
MCGIVGYIGEEQAAPILLDGLRRLEYRGYDSAGIAVKGDGVSVIKEKGRIDNLQKSVDENTPVGTVGIGHTRWATHGIPDHANAHPHKSQNGVVTLVHNGIIENYMELKNELINKGYVFKSDTDTEVIAQLFDSLFDGDAVSTMIKTAERLDGSYAVAMLVKGFDDKVFAMKKDSPLIVGKGEGKNYLASDIPAILPYTNRCYIVTDGEFIELSRDEIKVFGADGAQKECEIQTVNLSIDAAEKGGYDYFMAKEIYEQPKAFRDTVSPLIKNGKISLPFEFPENFVENLHRIYIVACGSAYHVGMTAKYIIEDMARIPVTVDIASEFRYRNPIIEKGDLCIFVSQSGETADTLASLREAKSRGAFTMSIVNVLFSTIARESDGVIYTNAGAEIAVATTKAFMAQLGVSYILSAYLANKKGLISDSELDDFTAEILALPEKIKDVLDTDKKAKSLAKRVKDCSSMFFIGRGIDYPLCLEGSLKLKEISYIHCEGYGAGELKHGTISLVEDGTVIAAVATDDSLYGKMVSNIKEVRARGAFVIAVVKEGTKGIEEIADEVIYIPKASRYLTPSLTVVPLQLLAYHTTVERGFDVDKPRNLAKSVTVE